MSEQAAIGKMSALEARIKVLTSDLEQSQSKVTELQVGDNIST